MIERFRYALRSVMNRVRGLTVGGGGGWTAGGMITTAVASVIGVVVMGVVVLNFEAVLAVLLLPVFAIAALALGIGFVIAVFELVAFVSSRRTAVVVVFGVPLLWNVIEYVGQDTVTKNAGTVLDFVLLENPVFWLVLTAILVKMVAPLGGGVSGFLKRFT